MGVPTFLWRIKMDEPFTISPAPWIEKEYGCCWKTSSRRRKWKSQFCMVKGRKEVLRRSIETSLRISTLSRVNWRSKCAKSLASILIEYENSMNIEVDNLSITQFET